MTVIYFRTHMEGTNELKLGVIKDWLESEIDSQDLDENVGDGRVRIYEDYYTPGLFVLECDMYLHATTPVDKYFDLVENRWNQLEKSGITYMKVEQYNSCTHDPAQPNTPCQPVTRLEWSA